MSGLPYLRRGHKDLKKNNDYIIYIKNDYVWSKHFTWELKTREKSAVSTPLNKLRSSVVIWWSSWLRIKLMVGVTLTLQNYPSHSVIQILPQKLRNSRDVTQTTVNNKNNFWRILISTYQKQTQFCGGHHGRRSVQL